MSNKRKLIIRRKEKGDKRSVVVRKMKKAVAED